jgi:hypothetical protein
VIALAVLAFTARLGLVVYGITDRQTLGVLTLAATFLLAVLSASFAAVAPSPTRARQRPPRTSNAPIRDAYYSSHVTR